MTYSDPSLEWTAMRSGSRKVVLTSMAVIVLDGFDVLLFGAVLSSLLTTRQWGITPAQAGFLGSLSMIGMLVGATLAGYLADRYGRRPLLLTCILFFSVFTALCAFAPNAEVFGILRLCSGLGFGGALPTAISVTMEYVRVDRRQSYGGMIIAGSPIGGALVAVIALFVVPWLGWRAMFLIASVVGLGVFVVAWRNIPESLAYLVRRGRLDKARRVADSFPIDPSAESMQALSEPADGDVWGKASPRILFVPGFRLAMILFPLVAAGAVLLTYGLNTWIPTILASAGYKMSTGLISLIGFDIGNAVGMVALSRWADRLGARRVIAGGFLVAAVGVGAVMLQPVQAVVLALLVLVGFCAGVVGPSFAFPGVYFPADVRGTAVGLTVGLSRLGGILAPVMVGLIVGSIFGVTGAFIAFIAVACVCAVLVALIPRGGRADLDRRPVPVSGAGVAQTIVVGRTYNARNEQAGPEQARP
jgi:MFS transporter, AAHS family, benzoate transport protein